MKVECFEHCTAMTSLSLLDEYTLSYKVNIIVNPLLLLFLRVKFQLL